MESVAVCFDPPIFEYKQIDCLRWVVLSAFVLICEIIKVDRTRGFTAPGPISQFGETSSLVYFSQ